MMRSRLFAAAVGAVFALGLSTAAGAASYTGTLSTFTGSGSGLPTSAPGITGAWTGNTSPITAPAGVFATTQTSTAPDPGTMINSPYQAATLTISSSTAASFGPGGGLGGGFGGAMGTGTTVIIGLGLQGFPANTTKFFASPTAACNGGLFFAGFGGCLSLPVNVGLTSTGTATAAVLGNPVQVSVLALGKWTTGAVAVNDHTIGVSAFCAGAGPCAPIALTANDFTTAFTVAGGISGSTITMVAPFVVKIRGVITENRAGYARLVINVPEPGTLLLFGAGIAGLAFVGNRKRA